MESTSWVLALKPGYYTIIVQYTTINVRPGNNRLPRSGTLARGNTYFPRSSAHLRSRPGTHIPRTSVSPEVHTPVGHRVSGTSPKASLALGEFPTRQSVSSLRSYGVFVPKYSARAGVPLRLWGLASTIRTLPNMVCGLPKQAHNSLNRSLVLFSRAVDQSTHL